LANIPGKWYLLLKTVYTTDLSIRNGLFVKVGLPVQTISSTQKPTS